MRFIFKIEPQAWQRVARSRFGAAFVPEKTRVFKQKVTEMMRNQFNTAPLDGALSVKIQFFLTKPKSVKREYPAVRGDLDNYVKAVLDALNGVLFVDDALICKLEASKLYSTGQGLIVLEIDSI